MTMTCDLRTSALSLPAVMLGGQHGDDEPADAPVSSWLDKVTADELTDEDAERERKLALRKSWIGALQFECDLLEFDGGYVNRCKVPSPPAHTLYRAFIRLPFVEEKDSEEALPRFYCSWS